ncbi:MAG: type II toxin-antitoxin system Phd/YefM family antitoxin [Rhodoglobus sp.]
MDPVNILDARNNLSQLVAAATAGEDVVIAKRGRPVVRLVPVSPPSHSATEALARIQILRTTLVSGRTTEEIDEQITKERAGWE